MSSFYFCPHLTSKSTIFDSLSNERRAISFSFQRVSRFSRDPSPTNLSNMASSPTYTKVHEWLMKSPDPPRQSRERTAAFPKSLPKTPSTSSPKPSLKDTPPSHEASPQKSSMICKTVKSVPASEDAIDIHNPGTNMNDEKNKHDHALVLLDMDEKTYLEEENDTDDDTGTYPNCPPSTSTWEDAVILLSCTIHWLTVMALVCSLTGLIIVWKTGYRLGLRTHARRIR